MLDELFRLAQMQFGNAVKARWFHKGDDCPGCGRAINSFKFKKKDSLSLNTFIFREHGVLIAYLLCGNCAKQVINASQNLPLHAVIEKTLKESYLELSGH